ncbi:MAG: L,D-transpeptidase [Actinomycetota bacterium]|nr:L,D-transpeptidase [Actinomycetota bacterium]
MTARLRDQTELRVKPRGRVVRRLARRTEFGSPRVLSVVRRRGNWLKVLVAELDNGRRGWVRADAVALGSTRWSLHVDRSARRLVVKRAGRRRWSITVAVGRPANPTPLGRFAVTDKLSPNRPASPYGCCILALTGHQTKLVPGWPGGDRLAIHATPQTSSIGQAASLGCLRAHTSSMRKLMKLVPVGSPVFIRA